MRTSLFVPAFRAVVKLYDNIYRFNMQAPTLGFGKKTNIKWHTRHDCRAHRRT